MVAGGAGSPPVELWKLDRENGFSGEIVYEYLNHYAYYPELFLVPNNFCIQT